MNARLLLGYQGMDKPPRKNMPARRYGRETVYDIPESKLWLGLHWYQILSIVKVVKRKPLPTTKNGLVRA